MKRDLYIRLLEFGDAHPTGFTFTLLKNTLHLSNEEQVIVDTYFRNAWANPGKSDRGSPPLETPFLILKTYGNSFIDEKNIYILSLEAKFKYIDFIELITAIKNARSATWIAISSILVSFIALGLSVHYSKLAIKKPTTIELNQFKTFQDINNKLDSLIAHPSIRGSKE